VATAIAGRMSVAAGVRAADLPGLTAEFFQQRDAVDEWAAHFRTEELPENVRLRHYPWELSLWNQVELERQLAAVGEIGRRGLLYPGAHLIQPEQICVQPGAKVKPGVVLDAEEGPIYIDRDALIQPNAVLEGPCCVGVGTIIRPGSLIRPGTSIGPGDERTRPARPPRSAARSRPASSRATRTSSTTDSSDTASWRSG